MKTLTSQLSIEEFGRQLIETNDLDPVYVLLWNARLPLPKLKKWLVAYWCFYHIGTSSWISDQADYWQAFRSAANSKEYPRCHERRHFRGENARKSTDYLEAIGIDKLFKPLLGDSISLRELMQEVQKWVGFGPWIAFKVADMLERLNLRNVRFDGGSMFLFDSPREGALKLSQIERGGNVEGAENYAVEAILERLESTLAPPRYERAINVQEAETILCKWNSHTKGHYKIGEDIEACKRGLLWRNCPTRQVLWRAGKEAAFW